MPIKKKSAVTTSTAISFTENGQHEKDLLVPLRKYEGLPFPKKIVLVGVLRDESFSMSDFRRPDFHGKLFEGVIARIGKKAASHVYVNYGVISSGVILAEIMPLSKLIIPDYELNGSTPLGTAFSMHVLQADAFFKKVFEQEVSVRHYETLVISDLNPEGEDGETTNAGIAAFIKHQANYHGITTVIGPSLETMNWTVAERLGVSKETVQYLDKTNPDTLLQFTLDSITQVSRKLG